MNASVIASARRPSEVFARSAPPFALAGVALVGFVLDEVDRPHDNLQGISTLGAGAVAGLLAAVVVSGRWAKTEERAARARSFAWDVIRFFLAFEMVRYGTAKLVGMQFYPQYSRLDERAVDMHSMTLAWAFFGRSYAYQAAAGVIEVASGVLVCFRRTTLLGACLMATALVNVVLVNFLFDVSVKLFASTYLAMDLALIARDAPRLWAFFLAVPPEESSRRTRWVRTAIIAGVLALPAAEILRDAVRHRVFRRDLLEGAWSVDQRSGLDDLAAKTPGEPERFYVEKSDLGVLRIGRRRIYFEVRVDEASRQVRLSSPDVPPVDGTFEIQGDHLHVAGERGGQTFSIDLTREFPRAVTP